ncbi:DNA/RNA non-specific endonuclease [Shouchella lonarensis]|uniref:Pre-toxin TG n=1 Tax=Shouchella lonarensis TaxID=1464122 RepID=A0A1G6H9S6_9BACI|nr:DNA/RNA non-specific endonuclease [Shouchella lonarensis]SDB90961.1 Pre-toxin TG [Shouchella lonarensis]
MAKFLDVAKHLNIIDQNISSIQRGLDHCDFKTAAITGVLDMQGSISGEGGEAMLRNYAELQLPALRTCRAFGTQLIEKLEKVKERILEFEPSEDGLVSEEYWGHEVPIGYNRVEEFLYENKTEIDALAARASAIMGKNIGKLDVTDVETNIDYARQHASDIVDGLHILDNECMSLLEEIDGDMEEFQAVLKQATDWTNTGGLFMTGVNINNVRTYFEDKKLHTEAPPLKWANDPMFNQAVANDPTLRRQVSILYTMVTMGAHPEVVAELALQLDDYYGHRISKAIIQAAAVSEPMDIAPGAGMYAFSFPIDYQFGYGRSIMEKPDIQYMGDVDVNKQLDANSRLRQSIEQDYATTIYQTMDRQVEAQTLRAKARAIMKDPEKAGEMDKWVHANALSKADPEKMEQLIYEELVKEKKREAASKGFYQSEEFSTMLDFTYGAGTVKSGVEAVTGVDPITGRQLDPVERILASVGMVFPVVKGASKAGKAVKGAGGAAQAAKGYMRVKYGDHYMRTNRKKVLKANVEYITPAGHLYRTDKYGRIRHVEGDLSIGAAKKNKYAQRVVGRGDRLPDDDGGHLIASMFKGSGQLDNLVPMNRNLNQQGAYRDLERRWEQALRAKPPQDVKVQIIPKYRGDSQRPEMFEVRYKIGNQGWQKKDLIND